MELESILHQKLGITRIKELAFLAASDPAIRSDIMTFTHSDDRRTGVNALWVLTHLPLTEIKWLRSVRDELTDMLLAETDVARKRMLLQLLREQEYDAGDIRTDLLDYCLSKINSECEPYAVRCFSLYAAFKMCRHFPELVTELEGHLEMLSLQTLSPGLKSALGKTTADIARLKRRQGKSPRK